MNSEAFARLLRDWTVYARAVIVKGSLVVCEDVIYSYQMKIGQRVKGKLLEQGETDDIFYLLRSQEAPSVTTRKHLGLVRNSLHIQNEIVKEVGAETLCTENFYE